MLANDRLITISAGASRKATNWQAQTLLISELWEKLRTPVRGSETLAEYMKLKKAQQDELKDVGGYVAGALSGPRRKANNVLGRELVTLDLDNIPAGKTDDVLRRLSGLGCAWCVYSTRKHHAAAPRLRVLLPLDRTVTADEYEPIARRAAEFIGLDMADPTTFEPGRLMYWPSASADSEYIFTYEDKPFLSADGMLATYADWHDTALWPALPGAAQFTKLAVKQGDPTAKNGIVGAFCRTYDIYRAMDELLPGVYEPVDNSTERYTYVGGSTTGGAVVYEGGKFLFSHHATDPCSGQLVNAFDLVRRHRFDDRDDEAAPGTPTIRLPSFEAMSELALSLPEVSALIARERYEGAVADFADAAAEKQIADATDWQAQLKLNSLTGLPKPTIDNILIILENDPLLKDRFALNQFAGRGEVLGSLPWDSKGKRRAWEDNDNQGLYWYFEKVYHITGNGKIDGALSLHSNKHAFNDVQDYLRSLTGHWDGVPRLDTLFADYLGAPDNAYTRAVTRKAFTAAVARAMDPGCKFDCMTILTGPQGIGKSTILDKMSRGWFNDSIRTFEGKEASELLQGVWLVEISELDAFRRTDVSRIKQFLSLRTDRFRAAYGKNVKEVPRSCVFFGTTNSDEFLSDRTGNRRFWPIDTGVQEHPKNVFRDLDGERDLIWAEAVMRWQSGEALYLEGEADKLARATQEEHREASSREGLIAEFLERYVPADWYAWELDKRRLFWATPNTEALELVPRDRVCAIEVWCECFGGTSKDARSMDIREINAIIAALPNWKRQAVRTQAYGIQKGFKRA